MKYLLIILCVFMASCSTTEKQLRNAIKNHGAKESAAYIAKNYPELFRSTEIHFKDTIRDTVLVTVPEVTHDTTYLPSEPCTLDYLDKRLRFTVKDGDISYKIFEKQVEAPVAVPIDTTFKAQPCPEEIVLNELREEILKKETEIAKAKSKSWFAQFRDVWFYISLILILGYGYMKLKP